ncbi:hypothetical protein Tco_1413944, partial [Tanacetum coccineum]
IVWREFTPPSEEGVHVQNIGVSQNVRRCLLPCFSAAAGSANRFPLTLEPLIQTVVVVDVRNTSDRNYIPISRVFDRFRNIRATSDQAEYTTETASCSRPLAVVDSGNHGSVYTIVVPVSNVAKAASAGLISNKTIKKLHHTVITEYLVNINKRRAFWSLNEDILKINDSDYQYAVSIKEDTVYSCLHSPKTTKETSPIRRIQRRPLRRIRYMECEYSGRSQTWSLLQEAPIRRIQPIGYGVSNRLLDSIYTKLKNEF